MLKSFSAIAVFGLLAIGSSVAAQGTQRVPDSYRPPPGMCRIWLPDVPPARQPEPTDCPAAIRRRPPNARVIFGEQPTRDLRPADRKKTDDRTKKLAPEKRRNPDPEKADPASTKPIRPEVLLPNADFPETRRRRL